MAKTLTTLDTAEDILIVVEESTPRRLGIRSVELWLGTVKVRFAAGEPQPLDQVFRHEIGSIVRSVCDGAAHAIGVVRHPDFRLRLAGLALGGYSIDVGVSAAGLRQFRLHFQCASGNALAVFRLSASARSGLTLFTPQILSGREDQVAPDRLFDEMLSQLYLPLVNLNAYLRHVLDGSMPQRGESLSESVVQLKTRAETLQFAFDRLIAEMMVDRYTASQAKPAMLLDTNAA